MGVALGVQPTFGVIASSLAIALLLIALQHGRQMSSDTLLGILSHSALSVGLVAISLMASLRIDLMGYLFGDILAVGTGDLLSIYIGGAVVLVALGAIWRPLLAITIDEDLARAEGVPALAVRLAFTALIALVIAIAMKIVGILLITSLLIIPAAAARRFATTPEGMAFGAAAIGVVSVLLGLFGSLGFDTPSGPSVVVAAVTLFAISLAVPRALLPRGA